MRGHSLTKVRNPSPGSCSLSLRTRHPLPQGERGSAFAARSLLPDLVFKQPRRHAPSPVFQKGARARPCYLSGAGYAVFPFFPSAMPRGWSALDLGSTRDRACLMRKSGKPDLRWRTSLPSCRAPLSGARAPLGAPSRLFCPRGRNFRARTGGLRPP